MRVVDAVEVMFGWQWEGRVIERFCEFTVDGREGWGVSEWHFSHKGRRMHGGFGRWTRGSRDSCSKCERYQNYFQIGHLKNWIVYSVPKISLRLLKEPITESDFFCLS